MLGYVPSEIARLVFGYLEKHKCEQSKILFMNENIHIQEYARLLSQGQEYPLTIEGKDLEAILQHYYLLTHKEGQDNLVNKTSETKKRNENPCKKSPPKKVDIKQVLKKKKTKFKSRTATSLLKTSPKFIVIESSHRNEKFRRKDEKAIDKEVTVEKRKKSKKQNTKHKKLSEKRPNKLVHSTPCNFPELSSHSTENETFVPENFVMDRSTSPMSPCLSQPNIDSDTERATVYHDSLQDSSVTPRKRCAVLSDLEPSISQRISSPRTMKQNCAQNRELTKLRYHGKRLKKEDRLVSSEFENDENELATDNENSTNNKNNYPHSRNSRTVQRGKAICKENRTSSGTDKMNSNSAKRSNKNENSAQNNLESSALSSGHRKGVSRKKRKTKIADSDLEQEDCDQKRPCVREDANDSATDDDDTNPLPFMYYNGKIVIKQEKMETVDLCSSDEERVEDCQTPRNNFLGVGSQEVLQRSKLPESVNNADEVAAATTAPDNQEGTSCISQKLNNKPEEQKEKLQELTNSEISGPESSEKENIVPNSSCGFKKPSLFVDSLLHSSPLRASSVTNSPSSSAAFSPAMITPLNSVEPEPPTRYPSESSPRLFLSEKRASEVILVTPVKQYHQAMFLSPKRKSVIPRRRLTSSTWMMSPSKAMQNNNNNEVDGNLTTDVSTDDYMDFSFLMEEVMKYSPFISKLAENINRKKGVDVLDGTAATSLENIQPTLPPSDSTDEAVSQDFIREILTETEKDSSFKDLLNKLVEKQESNRALTNSTSSIADVNQSLDNTIPMEDGHEAANDPESGGCLSQENRATEIATCAADVPMSTSETMLPEATMPTLLPETNMPTLLPEASTASVPINSAISVVNAAPLQQTYTTSTIFNSTPNSKPVSSEQLVVSGTTIYGLQTTSGNVIGLPVQPSSSANSNLRKILPSPAKKDILQQSLDSVQIQASPVKSDDYAIARTDIPQTITTSDYGTCIQVFNQPIMSSKPSGSIFVNGAIISPIKLPLSLFTNPGQFYNQCMSEVLPIQSTQNDQLPPFRTDLPIIVQAAPRIPIKNRRSTSRLAASRKTLRDRIEQATRNNTSNSQNRSFTIEQSNKTHVRTLDFGQKMTKAPVVDNSLETDSASSSPACSNSVVLLSNTTEYVSTTGQPEQLRTIDMSQLDLAQNVATAVSSPASSQTGSTPSSETESAAVTLMALSGNKVKTRIVKKDCSSKSRTCKERKTLSTTRKRKGAPDTSEPQSLLKKMNINKFLSTIHK